MVGNGSNGDNGANRDKIGLSDSAFQNPEIILNYARGVAKISQKKSGSYNSRTANIFRGIN